MAATIDELFHHITINRIVSELQGPSHRLCSYYGMKQGGPNTDDAGGSQFAWDLFNRTRLVPTGRLRGAGPSTAQAQKVGNVTATCYRSFQQIPLDYDKIYRNRGLGQSLGTFDTMAERYLAKQMTYQAEQFMNMRELLVMWMFRGGFELTIDGDNVLPVPTGSSGEITVDFNHPAANQGTVGGIFGGDWEDHANGNVIQELMLLNKHSAQNSRYPQTTAWVNATGAYHILQNAEVKSMGGTANTVFSDDVPLDYEGFRNVDGVRSNVMTFTLRGFPSMRFFIYDDLITLPNGNSEPFIPDGKMLTTPDPGDWLEWKNGSEPVQKAITGPISDEFGFTMWQETTRNPVGVNLYALDNGLPAPYVPGAWYFPTIHA